MKEKPKIQEIYESARFTAESLLNKRLDSIVSMARDGEEWRVEAEVLERKAIPDTQDILAKFEMRFDSSGDLLGYRRLELRHRSDMEVVQEEE
jgi:hypothetical protein